ncbi:hypothetical protein ASU33_14665 [Solirubrum puertoriconensis]|uniref:Cytochrome c domain-containing protein n=1 Tax=Solirubrum puertoriconensis TaxID=1751427 RepID=A0A9X0HKF8_SOLP1|nr:hypothetical protein ASU33_14665 [Solirubrum puertoriconensis]
MVVAGLLFLVACAAMYVQVRGIPTYKAPRVAKQSIAYTPERVAHGLRIATNICAECHLDKKTNSLAGKPLQEVPEQFGHFFSANITQDKQLGIGNWTDEQLVGLLRTNLGPDGRLRIIMPNFRQLSDEDLYSLVAFLRSNHEWVQPQAIASAAQEPSFMGKVILNTMMKPQPMPTGPIATPAANKPVELGRYLVTARYKCYDCHCKDGTDLDPDNPEKSEGYMAGGTHMVMPDGRDIVSRNLTPEPETGIGDWTPDQFVKAMKYGQSPHGPLRSPMPKYSVVTDDEARAIYAYLRSLRPVRNATPEDGVSAAVASN